MAKRSRRSEVPAQSLRALIGGPSFQRNAYKFNPDSLKDEAYSNQRNPDRDSALAVESHVESVICCRSDFHKAARKHFRARRQRGVLNCPRLGMLLLLAIGLYVIAQGIPAVHAATRCAKVSSAQSRARVPTAAQAEREEEASSRKAAVNDGVKY